MVNRTGSAGFGASVATLAVCSHQTGTPGKHYVQLECQELSAQVSRREIYGARVHRMGQNGRNPENVNYVREGGIAEVIFIC